MGGADGEEPIEIGVIKETFYDFEDLYYTLQLTFMICSFVFLAAILLVVSMLIKLY